MQDQEQRQGRIDCEATGSVGVAGHGGVAERGIIASFTASGQSMRHCIHCGAERPLRWGRTKRGLQRWRCRGCLRSFCAVTGTAIERLHSLDGFAGVLADMLGPGPRSCRELAAAFAVGRMTIWRWRKLICRAFERGQSMPRTAFAEEAALVEEAVLVVRESRKASREWADHARDPQRFPAPDRLRWIDYRQQGLPLPDPMDPYRIGIQVATTAMGGCLTRMLGRGIKSANAAVSNIAPEIDEGRQAASPVGHATTPRLNGTLACRLAAFLEPFRGPGSKYLAGYVAWFAACRNDDDRSRWRAVRRGLLDAGIAAESADEAHSR